MFSKFVLMVFALSADGSFDATADKAVSQTVFPYRAECDYAAKKINEQVPGSKALCFDIVVQGDRHEESFTQQIN
jgi:hypothetical protein